MTFADSTFTAVIIDDESHCRLSLQKQIEWTFPSINILQLCESGEQGLIAIEQLKPEIIFLDIEMPNMTGFEMLQKLDDIKFDVIFTTAHDQYALKAFEACATAYLLKPVDEEQLVKVINKIKSRSIHQFNGAILNQVMAHVEGSKQSPKVSIPTSEGLEIIDKDLIIRCESDGNYSRIYIKNREPLFISKTLKVITSLLNDADKFKRPHAAHIVNINFIAKYIKGTGGQIIMDDGTSIPVSKHKKTEFLNSLQAR